MLQAHVARRIIHSFFEPSMGHYSWSADIYGSAMNGYKIFHHCVKVQLWAIHKFSMWETYEKQVGV